MEKFLCAGCSEDGFKIQGKDRKELANMMKMHAKTTHKMDVTESDAENMVMDCK